MFSRIPSAHRIATALTLAATTALVVAATAVPSSAAPRPAFTFGRPAAAVQTFDVAPVTWSPRRAGSRVGPDKIAYNLYALAGPGRYHSRDIAVGHDGNLWITTDCDGTLERMTPKGVATAYTYGKPSNCNESPTSITPGPDGNLWFVDQFADLVGKITTAGVITTYPLPVASPCNNYPSMPLGIVAGSDGAMWFTVTYPGNIVCSPTADSPAIGRITTRGKMTFFYTAPPGTTHTISPERIAAGPDGNLYFIASLPQNGTQFAVGTITTGGMLNYTNAFGTSTNFNDYLTFGPDGNLWLTDIFDQVIFRVAGGTVTTFPVGSYGGVQEAAFGITTGPDHQLWFTTADDNELGQITTKGHVTFYPSPSCSPNNCGQGGGIVQHQKTLWHTIPGTVGAYDVVKASGLP
jgi:streptogramin lyase